MDVNERLKLTKQKFERYFSEFSSFVTHDERKTVAEFGVGKWGFGRFYAEKFGKVYGIDVEDYSAFHPGVEFALSDGSVAPIEDNSLDIIFTHSVLEHVEDLGAVLADMNRMLKVGGHLYLTVDPLYYSSYGAHLKEGGKRIDNWQHLDPAFKHYLTSNPLPNAATQGHYLNKMTSSDFLAAVGCQPWEIMSYKISFETKEIPEYVNRDTAKLFDMKLNAFKFIGRKLVNIYSR